MIARARADEPLGRGLTVGQALAHGLGHLRLLVGKPVDGGPRVVGSADRFAGDPQFVPGSLAAIFALGTGSDRAGG
jgi:hypothetical protein